MRGLTKRCSYVGMLLLSLFLVLSAGLRANERPNSAGPMRIGLLSSFFRDFPTALVTASTQPFRALMLSQTGLHGEIVTAEDADELGLLLMNDKAQLGVFHGVEFAWARQKYPDLMPLMIAVNQQRQLRAHLIVRQDSSYAKLADLKGKALAVPRQSREHCRLFLDRKCEAIGLDPQKAFVPVTTPANVEDALDDVVDGVVQATVVDAVSLECYKERKSTRYARLKDLQRSEAFPAAVIAYRNGALAEPVLRRFREGMLTANQNIRGKQLLMLWKLTGFEEVPADYEQLLTAIAKAYPPPASRAK